MSDLNSNVPVTIAPQNIQAIITGNGDGAKIKYIKDGVSDEFTEKSIVYTSGTGAIFKSGIPIGRVKVLKNDQLNEFNVDFYSDFSQLKYVFAEVITKTEISNTNQNTNSSADNQNPMNAKLKILEDELKIIEESNLKFKGENDDLKVKINSLNDEIINFKIQLSNQKQIIDQFNIDSKELEFLRLNLEYSHKCRKSFFNNKGFVVGSAQYKECVLNKGRIND